MDVKDCLKTLARDKDSDLYKALCWVENAMKHNENKLVLPEWEFKDLTLLHNQLVWLGFRAMIYTELVTGIRKIVVWW